MYCLGHEQNLEEEQEAQDAAAQNAEYYSFFGRKQFQESSSSQQEINIGGGVEVAGSTMEDVETKYK